jgi:Cys-rich repeat protein
LASISIATLVACIASGPPAGVECTQNSDCAAGAICIDTDCRLVCDLQSDCPAGQVCDVRGACMPGEVGVGPDIQSIEGNAPADPTSVLDGLVVNGTLLANAAFELRHNGSAFAAGLGPRSLSDTRAELVLPHDVPDGEFTLVATNRAGSDQATVQLTLPTLTADMLVDRINADTTAGKLFALRLLPVGTTATEVAAGNHNHDAAYAPAALATSVATAQNNITTLTTDLGAVQADVTALQADVTNLQSTACPPGYTHVTARTDIILCQRGASPNLDEVVKVGDFWVDRFEASVWQNAACSGTQYGATADNYPASFPDNGNWTTKLYACSKTGVAPSASLTWFQAQQACLASGKHLITNAEWQAAASGTYDPTAANDGNTNTRCNTGGAAARYTGLAGSTPAGTTSCISRYGVEDMVANLSEWTADWMQSGVTWATSVGAYRAPWPTGFGNDDKSWNFNGVVWHDATANPTEGLPAAVQRSGSWGNLVDSGSFMINVTYGPTFAAPSTGFRCAISGR